MQCRTSSSSRYVGCATRRKEKRPPICLIICSVIGRAVPEPPSWANHLGRLPSQRNLNNAFAYDLVPSVEVLTAALKAARRVNDFPTAVRIFEGTLRTKPRTKSRHWYPISVICRRICADCLSLFVGIRAKVENDNQYKQYLDQLEGLRKELGVVLREDLYPQN